MSNLGRLQNKQYSTIFKDDDYETDATVLKDLIPYLPCGRIYDPFYCNGLVKEEWKKLGRDNVLNEKKDAFEKIDSELFDMIISNIPFSIKKKCIDLCMSYDKPFILLMPIDTMGSLWFKEYFDKFQFIIPRKRYSFYKKGSKTNSSWFDTCWFCYKMNLPRDILKL